MSNILAVTYDTAISVTKSDTTADPHGPFAGVLAGVAGTVKITTVRGDVVSTTLANGQILPIATSRVWSTGSAATVYGLVALPFKQAVSA